MTKRLIGWALLVAFFGGLFGATVYAGGLQLAVIAWGAGVGGTALVWLALHLILS